MKAKTEVKIEKFYKINKEDKVISFGSCFATEIGKKMEEDGYQILNNPFGVLFNPASISSSLSRIINSNYFNQEDIILRDPHYGVNKKKNDSVEGNFKTSTHKQMSSFIGGYTSFHHHGSFSRQTETDFLINANESLENSIKYFQESKYIIITFGTSWVFRHKKRDIIVSNCHKHRASEFNREFLSTNEIAELFRPLISPEKEWIFTVSPIRHIKDGLHGNQISKATLLLSIEQLCNEFPNAKYFPTYEIVLDELRDYNYFSEDLVHPNINAINYVWEKWKQAIG